MKRYAFLVSCEKYGDFSSISFCESDAALIFETLTEYCDYQRQNVEWCQQYAGCDDTPEHIYEKMTTLIENACNGDTFLFYYAGHGIKVGDKGYLLLADSKLSDLQNTALDLKRINDLLKESKLNCFLVLDACHSGIDARSVLSMDITNTLSDTGCITLASCSENEESNPFYEEQQGVFTYFFVKQ